MCQYFMLLLNLAPGKISGDHICISTDQAKTVYTSLGEHIGHLEDHGQHFAQQVLVQNHSISQLRCSAMASIDHK